MYNHDKEKIIQRYNDRLNDNGGDYRALAVGNMERQFIRYDILSQIIKTSNCSILDIGCGYGDFYGYLLANKHSVNYYGYDMNPNLIDIAQSKYPGAKFKVIDVFSEDFEGKFDYIVSSSSFNNKLESMDNYEFIQQILKKSYEACNNGVAINFLTSYVDYEQGHAFYYSPEKVFKYCKSITKRVTLRHDYNLYEFTIYLYKEDYKYC